jgi:hypothetical protein
MLQELYSQIAQACSRVGMNWQFANELAEVVIGAFGRSFFENPRRKKDPITLEQIAAHPLIRNINTTPATPESGVVDLMELGLYLRTFAADPAIGGILASLKNEKLYESTRFHLAIAFRLVRAGCSPTLEPKTDRGKSDILFTFDDRPYVAECYRIHTNFFEQTGEFESFLARRLNSETPAGKKYRFKVHLNTSLTYDGMRRMLRKAIDMLSLFHSREDLQIVQLKHGPHILGIEDITGIEPDPDYDQPGKPARPLRNDEADLIVCRTLVMAENIFAIQEGAHDEIRGSRTLIRRGYKRTSPKNPYSVLEARIGDKLKQTKITGGVYGRLLFVEFPWGLELESKEGVRKGLRDNFARRFPDVGAVALLERRPVDKHFGYRGTVLWGNEQAAIPRSLIEKLNEVELQGLFTPSE